ncbi:hypothetical protein ACLKA7_001398 [Drosophila subpalustris]
MSKCRQQQQHQFFESVSEHEDQEHEQYDPLANLLSLQLRKPARWNLELNTSRSCSNIALPRILLYDHKGTLILEANGKDEQTYRPSTVSNRRKPATPANLTDSSHQAPLLNEFNGLCIEETDPSSGRLTPVSSQKRQQLTGSCIEFSTHELPDWQAIDAISSRRSSSLRGVRFEDQEQRLEQEQSQQRLLGNSTPPFTSTLTMTANSSTSGTQEKRRYRRSQSSGHHSILERLSMSRGRFSSPEYVQEQTLEHGPKYFLRSSKAGTLVIKDESFSRVRQRRRRCRDSSNENVLIQQDRSPSERVVQVSSPQQRGREPLYTTSDDDEVQVKVPNTTRQSRSRRNQRHCFKDVTAAKLPTVDPGNYVCRASTGATMR